MTRRLLILGGVTVAGVLLAGFGAAQGPHIPPTSVPQTPEPGLANPNELPQKLPADLERLTTPVRPAAPSTVRPAVNEEVLQPASADPAVPVVVLRLRAPSHVASGSPVEYTITVENTSQASAHHVTVTNPIPANARFDGGADPKPDETTDKLLRWKFGTLAPGVSKTIKFKLTPTGDAEFANVARVTFEHGQRVTTVIDKPRVTLKHDGPQYAHENDRIPVKLIVENSGRAAVKNLFVKDVVGDGLLHENSTRERNWPIELLKPGEKRVLEYVVLAGKQGPFTANATVTEDQFRTNQQSTWSVMVGKPVLFAEIKGSPKTYLTQPAEYAITIRNDGDVPLDNVTVAVTLPDAVTVARATDGSQKFTDRIQWGIKRFEPKGARTYRLALQTAKPGKVRVIAQVLARGSTKQADTETDFQGATALRLRVRESGDRVQVGDAVKYVVTVQNTGTVEAKDARVEFDLPTTTLVNLDQNTEKSLLTPDKKLVWGPLNVPPGATRTMTVTAVAVRDGVLFFQAALTGPKTELPAGPITQQVQTVIEPKSK